MDGIRLQKDPERCETLLEISIQYDLKWHKRIDDLQSSLKKRLAGLSKLRFMVPYYMLKTITQGIFNSVLIYCLPLYGGFDKGQLSSI